MGVKVTINIDPNTIINNHNLQDGGAAQKLMANEVLRFSDPYTPMDSSMLKSNVSISDDGKQIIYHSPYAHYQFKGVSKNGNPLNYNEAPMRGKEWTKRAMADHIKDVEKSIAGFIGGRVK